MRLVIMALAAPIVGAALGRPHRRRAHEALRARARQQAAVAALGQRALLGGEIGPLLEDAVRTLADTLDVELTKVLELLPPGDELVMRAGVGWGRGEHRVAAGGLSQAGYTLASRAPVVVEDLPSEERFRGPRLLLDQGVVSGMSVIIAGRGRPFGILGAHTRRRRRFTDDDVHFLQAVANVLAEAIARKRAEAALAESEERFRQIAEHVREVVYIQEVSGVELRELLYVNPAYEAVWGRPRAGLHEDSGSWLEAIHPDDRPRVVANLPARVSGFLDEEYRIERPDGAIRWIRDRSSPVLDAGGRPYRLVGIAEDVTELREAAESARRLAASEASVRARDEVLAVVAHDLRNPLSAIALAAAQLEKPVVPADKRAQRARTIRRAAARADRLIQDLLDVARIETNQLTIEPAVLDVASAAREACDALAQRAADKSITVECSICEDVPLAFGDRDRVLQVLGNLMGNALKFTPAGGRIHLRAHRCPEGVEISVEDTGPGIPPEALPHVFDRFWRARPTDRRSLGLGLAIVKGIVSAHRGRVWVESEPGIRTVFHFTLPPAPARGPAAAGGRAPSGT